MRRLLRMMTNLTRQDYSMQSIRKRVILYNPLIICRDIATAETLVHCRSHQAMKQVEKLIFVGIVFASDIAQFHHLLDCSISGEVSQKGLPQLPELTEQTQATYVSMHV